MKLKDLGVVPAIIAIRLTGTPTISTKTTSDGMPYYEWALKSPITVRCSVDPEIEPLEVESLFVREEALNLETWTGSEEEGFHIPGWKADFSKNQEIAIYQETTIAMYIRDNRKDRTSERRGSINERIKKIMEGKNKS